MPTEKEVQQNEELDRFLDTDSIEIIEQVDQEGRRVRL